MIATTLRNGLFATAAAGALMVGFNISAAQAAALPFSIDPNVLVTGGGYPASVTATDINGISDATIHIVGPTTQTESGWLQVQSLTNNGNPIGSATSGIVTNGSTGAGPNTYDPYFTFQGTVNGIGGFTPGNIGTIGPGDYTFKLLSDTASDDTFLPGDATTGANPTVGGNTANDRVLAVGTSVAGSAGFQSVTGAPTFAVLASFVVCDGTTGQGVQGGTTVAAAGCGTFDARSYFVSPTPFYAFDFNSSTSGSINNLTVGPSGAATLNGIVADINFIPEPASLSIFGAALALLAAFSWRRKKNSAAV